MVGNKRIQKTIARVVDKIVSGYDPDRIILYGSYAHGRPNADSDIDLFIVKDTGLSRVYRFAEIKRIIYNPKRRIAISPLVYTPRELSEWLKVGDDLVKDILDSGETLYVR